VVLPLVTTLLYVIVVVASGCIVTLEQVQFIKYLTQVKGINLRGTKILLEAISYAEKEGVELKKLLFPQFKVEKLI